MLTLQKIKAKFNKMKRLFVAIIAVAAVFAISGCAKQCHCVEKFNGKVLTEYDRDKVDGEACGSNDSYVSLLGNTNEFKCTPVLF